MQLRAKNRSGVFQDPPTQSLRVRNFSTIRFVLKKKVAANWLFGSFLTLSFTFIKRSMVGNLNLVSYVHFVFLCNVTTFSPFEKRCFLIFLTSVRYL